MKIKIEKHMGYVKTGNRLYNFNQSVVDDIQLMLNNGADTILPNSSMIEFFSHREETDKEEQDRLEGIKEARKIIDKIEYENYLKLKEKYEK